MRYVLSITVAAMILVLADSRVRADGTPGLFANDGNTPDSSNGTDGTFDKDRETFMEVDTPGAEPGGKGLGPVYNATSCVDCHQNPITGGGSQSAELRAGHLDRQHNTFKEPAGGSLIHQRAIDASIQEVVQPGSETRTLRMSPSLLGDAYVECIPDKDISDMQKSQFAKHPHMAGWITLVSVLTGSTTTGGKVVFETQDRIGRFGWKCQEGSLLNFAAGAYLNEVGITSPTQTKQNCSNGHDVSSFEKHDQPEDKPTTSVYGDDVMAFTRFMRALNVPPQDPKAADPMAIERGRKLFTDDKKTGCAFCHVPEWTTAAEGTTINDFQVLKQLASQKIHPYSDFMLHDIGTGDGIVQTQHAQRPSRGAENAKPHPFIKESDEKVFSAKSALAESGERLKETDDAATLAAPDDPCGSQCFKADTAFMIRTVPLWGLRTRPQLMHDGKSLSVEAAILRHRNQGSDAAHNYQYRLSQSDRNDLLAFLKSL
jgi:CxxC motif-containing protein (DUF1111 family)